LNAIIARFRAGREGRKECLDDVKKLVRKTLNASDEFFEFLSFHRHYPVALFYSILFLG